MTDWCSRMRLPQWRHQAKEWEHRDAKARMRRWQMRTGKTKSVIDELCYWHETGQIDGAVIFGPNNVHLNWARKEVPKHVWAGVEYRSLAWSSYDSHKLPWERWFQKLCRPTGALDLFMVNFEALNSKRFIKEFLEPFLKSHPRYALVIDETHEVRGNNSARSKQLRRVRSKAAFRRGLSGTITDNSPLHAWSQYECLLEKALGYREYPAFEDHFARKELQVIRVKGGRTRQFMKVVEFRNMDELREAMARLTSVVLREECDDMPALVREECRFTLAPEQKRAYNEIVRGNIARLEGGEVIPPREGAGVKAQLQQISRGWFVGEDGEVLEIVDDDHNPALQALLSQVAIAGPKVIVWCRFVEDIRRCMRALRAAGHQPVDYYGGTRREDRPRHIDRFVSDPSCGPFVGQPLAGGQGLELPCDDIFWYSHLDGDLIHRKQANERGTVMGGRRVFVTDLIADGSGDDKLISDLEDKHLLSEDLSGEGLRAFLAEIE